MLCTDQVTPPGATLILVMSKGHTSWAAVLGREGSWTHKQHWQLCYLKQETGNAAVREAGTRAKPSSTARPPAGVGLLAVGRLHLP